MNASGERYGISATVMRMRLGSIKLAYNFFFLILSRDPIWQEPLFRSFPANPYDRVLVFGTLAASSAMALATRRPDLNIVAADANPKAVERARKQLGRRGFQNVVIIKATQPLAFADGSFDRVVGTFTFHCRERLEKLRLAGEMLRLLRHRGTLHVADYDRPALAREALILKTARVVFGPNAIEPHLDASWTECLTKAGFAGVHRLSTHSVTAGRIGVVQARKR